MSHSIYHFFANLVKNRNDLSKIKKLDDYSFNKDLISCQNDGKWPDLAIKLNNDDDGEFTGGELIELKDSKYNTTASFNSTIPKGIKNIASIIEGKTNKIRKQMEDAGDNPMSLPEREVYYLVRGNRGKAKRVRVCLIHGSFFETIPASALVKDAFRQVFDERITETNTRFHKNTKEKVVNLFDNRKAFADTRHVQNASVSLRFRPMTQAEAEGNILGYNEIIDNSLTFLVPIENQNDGEIFRNKMRIAFKDSDQIMDFNQLDIFTIKHKLNGPFMAFQ